MGVPDCCVVHREDMLQDLGSCTRPLNNTEQGIGPVSCLGEGAWGLGVLTITVVLIPTITMTYHQPPE